MDSIVEPLGVMELNHIVTSLLKSGEEKKGPKKKSRTSDTSSKRDFCMCDAKRQPQILSQKERDKKRK